MIATEAWFIVTLSVPLSIPALMLLPEYALIAPAVAGILSASELDRIKRRVAERDSKPEQTIISTALSSFDAHGRVYSRETFVSAICLLDLPEGRWLLFRRLVMGTWVLPLILGAVRAAL